MSKYLFIERLTIPHLSVCNTSGLNLIKIVFLFFESRFRAYVLVRNWQIKSYWSSEGWSYACLKNRRMTYFWGFKNNTVMNYIFNQPKTTFFLSWHLLLTITCICCIDQLNYMLMVGFLTLPGARPLFNCFPFLFCSDIKSPSLSHSLASTSDDWTCLLVMVYKVSDVLIWYC